MEVDSLSFLRRPTPACRGHLAPKLEGEGLSLSRAGRHLALGHGELRPSFHVPRVSPATEVWGEGSTLELEGT